MGDIYTRVSLIGKTYDCAAFYREVKTILFGRGMNCINLHKCRSFQTHFTIIAPDLRGVEESEKPAGGYDKKTMATDLHELMEKLDHTNINLAGHHIGLMVAYSYAAQFPAEVKKVFVIRRSVTGG